MAHLGERLRQQRLAKGVSLQHISEQTRIGVRYLEALEAGDFKQLPGAIFARSFVRQYAELVGMSIASLESELQQIFPSEDVFPAEEADRGILRNDTLLAANGPVWRRLPLTALSLATALVISSLLYVGWQRVVLHNETSEPPTLATPAKPPATRSQPPGTSPSPPAADSPTVRPAAVSTPDLPAAGEPAKPITELQAPAGSGGAAMALRVVASERTWVSIAANGKFVYSGILEPYEERSVTGVEHARMVIGNSTGVAVFTDGRSIGPIGPQGSVRVVVLTPGAPPQISNRAEFPGNREAPSQSGTDRETEGGSSATKLD